MQMQQLIACTCLAVAATSCSHFRDDLNPAAPTSATVVGSGRVITEVRPVSRFTAIAVNGAIQAVVMPGNESLEITAEDNIAPLVETLVTGGRLTVGLRPGTPSFSTAIGVVCRIGSRTLRDIQLAGASRVQMDDIEAQEFSVSLAGASAFFGSGTVEQLRMDVSGASRFTAPSLRARTADATLSGASAALVRVIDALVVRVSGASFFEYFGDPVVHADTSGASLVRRVGS